ncbi:MAG TPA: hypothetical protein VFV30_04690 [Novosphingobium sp.]|nr:hypothetical protein [Novosphingobium sp.]
MEAAFDNDIRRAVRASLAREAYAKGKVRLTNPDLGDSWWLVTTHRGLYSASPDGIQLVSHGWYFGVDRHGDHIYLYENCGLRDRESHLGRIVRLHWDGRHLSDPAVLVTGLHGNAHQLKVIGGLLCLLDTANQRILRFTLDGAPVDTKTPLPPAPANDTSGAYHHINSIAEIGGRVAILLHNGKAPSPRKSELVWLDADWQVAGRGEIDGYMCHDIVADGDGTLWHCASASGELTGSNGERIKLSDSLMTRALSFCRDHLLVGLSSFGERQIRDGLSGEVLVLDRDRRVVAHHDVPAGPADVVALR